MTTTQNSLTPKMGSTTAEQLRDDAVAADADGDAALARRLRLRASLGRDAEALGLDLLIRARRALLSIYLGSS